MELEAMQFGHLEQQIKITYVELPEMKPLV
jgi:hypothetical protein